MARELERQLLVDAAVDVRQRHLKIVERRRVGHVGQCA